MAALANADIAQLFNEMADLTEIGGGETYRIRSFRRAARIIENLPEPADHMVRHGTLDKRYGIGEGSVHRVKQILRTGTCDDLVALRAQFPAGLRELLEVKGLGAKTIRKIHRYLGIGNLAELEHAARSGRLAQIPRMGFGTVQRIIQGLDDYHKLQGKIALSEARRIGMAVVDGLKSAEGAIRVELAGSVRRGKALTGDLDVLVAADDGGPIISRYITLPQVDEVLIQGTGRGMVRLVTGQQMDLRILPPESFGAGLHYFTGSKLHNIAIRERANRMGLKISDHGVFRRPEETRIVPGTQEEEIFHAVKLPWIPPELRENTGEIQAAEDNALPRLIEKSMLQGDLHMHTTASDGTDSARAMALAGLEAGLKYIAITDHSKSVTVTGGLDERGLLEQLQHLEQVRREVEGIEILAGIEVDILPDGSLDLDPEILRKLDWVIGSVHLHTNLSESEMTRRVLRAMESGVVDCIGHPTGRRPGRREAYAIDLDRIFRAARELGVALEVNGGPNRMDLPDVACRQARELGVLLAIDTDAHAARHVAKFDYALAMARRGWIEKRHVLNALPVSEIRARRQDRLRTGFVNISVPVVVPEEEESVNDPDANAWKGDKGEGSEAAIEGEIDLDVDPLPAEVLERIERYLRGTADPMLERALKANGEPAMQRAFNLAMRARAAR
jgi:DNA polymerase (family 10)